MLASNDDLLDIVVIREDTKKQSPTKRLTPAKMFPTGLKPMDFGSKGLYKPTTTIGGKTTLSDWVESVEAHGDTRMSHDRMKFRETANLRLSGTTFDSKHMSQFMSNCPFVTRPSPKSFLRKS